MQIWVTYAVESKLDTNLLTIALWDTGIRRLALSGDASPGSSAANVCVDSTAVIDASRGRTSSRWECIASNLAPNKATRNEEKRLDILPNPLMGRS